MARGPTMSTPKSNLAKLRPLGRRRCGSTVAAGRPCRVATAASATIATIAGRGATVAAVAAITAFAGALAVAASAAGLKVCGSV